MKDSFKTFSYDLEDHHGTDSFMVKRVKSFCLRDKIMWYALPNTDLPISKLVTNGIRDIGKLPPPENCS